ncbi:MAG TPA: hypothetical protein VMF91_01290 [Bryobacteraceae bacterium]|nr:hypothetical protein [Bryobacteraceae bacterium]
MIIDGENEMVRHFNPFFYSLAPETDDVSRTVGGDFGKRDSTTNPV